MDDELRSHLDLYAEDLVRAGVSPRDAARRALVEFGGIEGRKEDMHEALGLRLVDELRGDLHYAFRQLRRSPAFTTVAVLSLALGIGATAAIFSFADALLLRPLPLPNASQVVTVVARMPTGRFGDISYPDFVDVRNKSQSFDGMVAYNLNAVGLANDAKAQPRLKMGFLVSADFFRVLGVEPQLGRGFRPEEERVPGRDAVIVLAHEMWTSEFGADPSIIGRRLRLNGIDFSVVGVAPESFTGLDQYIRPAFFVPAMMGPTLLASNRDILTNRDARAFNVKGRLKQDVSIQAANMEVSALARSLEQAHPETNRGVGGAVRTEIQTRMDEDPTAGPMQGLLLTIVFLVLLIACANIANLMLGRAQARVREIAVRLAIGAGRWRLLRQLMVESVLLALTGGALGLLIAAYAVRIFSTIEVPGDAPVVLAFQLDARVLAFTGIVSVASALLFGLVPALQSTKANLVPALKTGDSDHAGKRFFGRHALVVAQIAGSLVLLVVAAQLTRGFASLLAANHGFRTDHRITMRVDPTLAGYTPGQIEQFYQTLTDRARAVPGVKSAALSSSLPMTNGFSRRTAVPEGYEFPPGISSVSILSEVVDQHYFETFGVGINRVRANAV